MYARWDVVRKPTGTLEDIAEQGNNLRSAGLLYDALRYYNAANNAGHPDLVQVLFLKGVVFEQLRRSDDALGAYSDALRTDPSPEDEFRIRMRWTGLRASRG